MSRAALFGYLTWATPTLMSALAWQTKWLPDKLFSPGSSPLSRVFPAGAGAAVESGPTGVSNRTAGEGLRVAKHRDFAWSRMRKRPKRDRRFESPALLQQRGALLSRNFQGLLAH